MSPTIKQIEELEVFFNSITIPTIVKVNKAITQTNAPKFISENIQLLKQNEMTPIIAATRYSHLLELKAAILDPR